MPYVPEALPRVTPKAPSKLTLRSFPRRVPRVPRIPRAERIPPDAARARHLSRVPKLKQPTLRKISERATCPRVPKRTPHPGALRASRVSRDSPRENPESPRVCREPSECEPPEASECATCRAQDFHPDELRVRHLSRAHTTRASPGSPAKPSPEDPPPRPPAARAPCSGNLLFPTKLQKNPKKAINI